ncbi:MAG TPA: helix-turn-helix transcriptional regulator [Bryobacteraceae bacterium]|nr:helix-turn-helix transcriptional regulator [Bryobacteraceae bacterium]
MDSMPPPQSQRVIQVVRHESALGSWIMILSDPAPQLRSSIVRYCDYTEHTPGPLRRRELPSPQITLIIDLGPTVRILNSSGDAVIALHHGGFVAGLDNTWTLTESLGHMRCIQVDFTLTGAQRILHESMTSIAGCTVSLDDYFGSAAQLLRDQLLESRRAESRFQLLDEFFTARLTRPGAQSDWVESAWDRIQTSGGRLSIRALAEGSGFSARHLESCFKNRFGMTPKQLARLVRFNSVLADLRSGRFADWTSIAVNHGYFDQAHFIRDFKQYSGGTPTEFWKRQLPDRGGVRG